VIGYVVLGMALFSFPSPVRARAARRLHDAGRRAECLQERKTQNGRSVQTAGK
jgi:hypothetical protein